MPSVTTPPPDEIADAVRGRQAWGIRALQTLIAIDSIAPEEAACQEALAEILRAEGVSVAMLPLDDGRLRETPGYIESGLPLENRPNLIATMGGAVESARSVIFNSHIDTVAWAETAHRWDVHPLSGEVRDNRLFGRGSMDAKGQIMAALVAMLALKDLGYEPPGRVIAQSVVSEEPDGNGTLSVCAQGITADAAINLEATDNEVAYGHRGILGLRYVIQGQARHASLAGKENAIVVAGQIAAALHHGLDGWQHPTDREYGPPTVNVGRIVGGDDIFTSPHTCTLDCGLRYAPGTAAALLNYLNGALERRPETNRPGIVPVHNALVTHFDASSVAPNSDLTRTFLKASTAVTGEPRLTVFPACCDARHFNNRYGIPTLIFGPGKLTLAHTENEYLDLDQWQEASLILARFITLWCVERE